MVENRPKKYDVGIPNTNKNDAKVDVCVAGDYENLVPSDQALEQPKWGTSEVEIPLLPITARGVLLDSVTADMQAISKSFLSIRNI